MSVLPVGYNGSGARVILKPSFRVVGAVLVEEAASFLEYEPVDITERSYLTFRCGAKALHVDDVRTIHRPRECINRSSSFLWNLTARPGPVGLRRPSR